MRREQKIVETSYDLVVIGGGLAGICATIAAARLGDRVALVHDRPMLGGNSSSECRVFVSGAAGLGGKHGYWRNARETGIIEELTLEAWYRMPYQERRNGMPLPMWDLILEERVRQEPLATVYLNTSAQDVALKEDGAIDTVQCYSSADETTYKLSAPLFLDSSGDGAIAFKAGAEFHYGREASLEYGESRAPVEADESVLPASMMYYARDYGRPMPFRPPSWVRRFPTDDDLPFRNHERFLSGFWWISRGGKIHMIDETDRIRQEDLAALLGVWDHIKNYGDHGANNYALEWVATIPAKRESRRFIGDHILTQNDVEDRPLFPDRVAYAGWPMDLHPSEGIDSPEPPCRNPPLQGLHSIPFRCLYSRNIPNLLLAGRNVSASHAALGSIRVQKTCAIMGQAAGTAAHFCRIYSISPRQLFGKGLLEVQQQLLKDDCYLIDLPNSDAHDLGRSALATASSSAPLSITRVDEWITLDVATGQLIPLSADRIDRVRIMLASALGQDTEVTLLVHPANSVYDFSQEGNVIARSSATVSPSGGEWVEFKFGCAIRPGLYWFEVAPAPGIAWARSSAEPMGTQAARWEPVGILSHDELMMPGIRRELLASGYGPQWRMERGSFCLDIEPSSYPYGPENATNGVARAHRGANIWISDPAQGLPQWLALDFGADVELGSVQLAFDTDLDASENWRGSGMASQCVRDYRLEIENPEGGWVTILRITGNYQRLRRHRFPPVTTRRLRLVVEATNGDVSARLYEIRAYPPRAE